MSEDRSTRRKATTFCRICEAICGLKVEIEGDRITQIKPDQEHVTSKGYACIKGLSFEKFRMSPDRITHPLKKVNGEYQEISWEQAFSEIGSKVKQLRKTHGDDSVGLYFGNPVAFSPLIPFMTMGFVKGLNTIKFFNPGSIDVNNKFVVSERMYGSSMSLTFPDVDRTNFIMIIGSNPAVSKMSMIHMPNPIERLKKITERGGRVVHVNPARTESAKQVGEHIFLRPDTDVYFLAAFLHEVLERNAVDHQRIDQYMNGFEELQSVVADWTPEKQAEVSGISAETLRSLVTAYLESDGAALYASTGLNLGRNGTLAFWLLEVINAITGNLDRLGGTLMGKGIFDYQKVLAKNPTPTNYSRIGNFPSFCEALPVSLMADEILTPGEGQVRAMFVLSGNPLIMGTQSNRLEEAFATLELVVSIEIVRNKTANHADYILPGTHFAERPDFPLIFTSFVGINPIPWFQYTDKLVNSPGECRDEFWIMHQLCKACDAPFFGSRIVHSVLNLGEFLGKLPLIGKRLLPAQERLIQWISRMGKQGSLRKLRQFPHGKLLEPWQSNNYLGKRVVTASGKVELAPQEFIDLAQIRLPKTFASEKEMGMNQIKLISKRERYSHNAWTHNDEAFIKGKRNTNYLYIHPEDATRFGISDGQKVSVSNQAGEVTVPASVTEDMMPGAVALPQGWGHQDADGLSVARTTTGANSNILAPDGLEHTEPISGLAHLNGIPVSIKAL